MKVEMERVGRERFSLACLSRPGIALLFFVNAPMRRGAESVRTRGPPPGDPRCVTFSGEFLAQER